MTGHEEETDRAGFVDSGVVADVGDPFPAMPDIVGLDASWARVVIRSATPEDVETLDRGVRNVMGRVDIWLHKGHTENRRSHPGVEAIEGMNGATTYDMASQTDNGKVETVIVVETDSEGLSGLDISLYTNDGGDVDITATNPHIAQRVTYTGPNGERSQYALGGEFRKHGEAPNPISMADKYLRLVESGAIIPPEPEPARPRG